MPAFSCSTEGAVATFSRKFGNESITIRLDANSGMDMDTMGAGDTEGDTEEEEEEVSHVITKGFHHHPISVYIIVTFDLGLSIIGDYR